MSWFAQQERARLIERCQVSIAVRKAEGRKTGRDRKPLDLAAARARLAGGRLSACGRGRDGRRAEHTRAGSLPHRLTGRARIRSVGTAAREDHATDLMSAPCPWPRVRPPRYPAGWSQRGASLEGPWKCPNTWRP